MSNESGRLDNSSLITHHSSLVIRDTTAIPMTRLGEVLEHVDILIRPPEIAAIGPTGTLDPPPDARVLDGRGKLTLPGLVNAHAHIGITLLRTGSEAMALEPWLDWLIPKQSTMEPDDFYRGALLACLEQTRAGITTFADMLYMQEPCSRATEEAGLRAVVSMSVMERDPWDDNPAEGVRRLEGSIAFAERWQGRGNGRITVRLAPHAVYTVRPSLLRHYATESTRLGLGVQIHCSETRVEVEGCRARHGLTPPALLNEVGLLERPILLHHAVHLTDEDIALVDRPNVGLSHNPGSNLKLQSGRARLPELLGRRLSVGIGTDSAVSNDTLDLFKEVYLAAVLHDWPTDALPSWRVLEAATIGGARALGLADRIGSLEPGKRADVILVDLSDPRHAPASDPARQLAYTARGSDVATTIVDGEILMDDRVVRRLDPEEIVRQARIRGHRLLR
jgi:5-methylthioadenosine/S-adenosylhomocysteine deaminase